MGKTINDLSKELSVCRVFKRINNKHSLRLIMIAVSRITRYIFSVISEFSFSVLNK